MRYGKVKLGQQLLVLAGIAFVLLFTSLGVVLPQMLIPFAESNNYSYLSEPLKIMDSDVDKLLLDTEVAYIYVVDDLIRRLRKKLPNIKLKSIYGYGYRLS